MAKLGRPKGERQTTKATFVRLTDDEAELVGRAMAKLVSGVVGARVTVASFLRDAGVAEARRIVGAKK